MQHDAVIFDLFGTLVLTVSPDDYHEMLVALASHLGAEAEAFESAWRDTLSQRESGALGGLAEVLRRTSQRSGHEPGEDAVANAAQRWLDIARGWLEPRATSAATVQAFRAAGYGVGLLSNCSSEVPPVWGAGPLRSLVDAAVFSCDVGLLKPDPRIYSHVCGLLDVPPERCLFVGDGGSRELTGARDAGMSAVLLRVPGEEHTWFDANYRLDALEWQGATIGALDELVRFI